MTRDERSPALTRRERIEGGLVGLLVGDAVGVPYEFHPAEELPARALLDLDPPPDFARAHPRVPAGTWSDDGAQALCLLASLHECGRLDIDDLGRRFVAWYREGYMAVGGIVFDIGIQTEQALHRLIDGVAALEAGPSDERANGNGSLMRVLPLALWHRGTDAELARDAHAQSRVTHGHPRAQAACALYCLWARRELDAIPRAWDSAVTALRGVYSDARLAAHRAELERHVLPGYAEPRGTGYVVDSLHSARLACEASSYEATVKAAIALGNDTDTTACVAGGIAGVRHGVNAIPARWRSALRGGELLAPLLTALSARG